MCNLLSAFVIKCDSDVDSSHCQIIHDFDLVTSEAFFDTLSMFFITKQISKLPFSVVCSL